MNFTPYKTHLQNTLKSAVFLKTLQDTTKPPFIQKLYLLF